MESATISIAKAVEPSCSLQTALCRLVAHTVRLAKWVGPKVVAGKVRSLKNILLYTMIIVQTDA